VLALLALAIAWTAPEGCPTADEFRARVAEDLGDAPAGDREVRVDVERDGDVWRVRVTDGERARELAGASCDEVAEAGALVVAMLLREEPAPPPRPRLARAVVRPPPPRVVVQRPPRTVSLRVTAAGAADTGTLPAVAAGVRVGAAAGLGPMRVELDGAYWPQRSDGGLDVGLWAGAARGCAWFVCAGAEVGRLSAQTMEAEEANSRWLALTLGASGRLRLGGRLALAARVEAVAPIERPIFLVGGVEAHQPAVVSVRAVLGVELMIR
jgi:hypothetical protein